MDDFTFQWNPLRDNNPLVEHDYVVPFQFYGTVSLANWSGAKKLLFAVLEKGIEDYFRCSRKRTKREDRLFAEIEAWFASEDLVSPFSFENICAVLAMDAGYIRHGLQNAMQTRRDAREASVAQQIIPESQWA